MLKSTPTPETNPEETNHTVSDNETDANLGQPEAPSKSVERVVGGTTEDGGLRRRRVGRGVTGGLGGLGGTGGSGYVGGIGGSGGYGEGPRLRVGSWTLEDSTLFSQVTGSMDGEGGTGREESALFSQFFGGIGGEGGGEGGTGREGGTGGRRGRASRVKSWAQESALFSQITGGIGGEGGREESALFSRFFGGIGGEGGTGREGGAGRRGQASDLLTPPLSIDEKVRMPNLTVAEFCQRYSLSEKICKLLEGEGFETVEGLFEATSTTLRDAGFKGGHIAELKRALKELLIDSRAHRSSV